MSNLHRLCESVRAISHMADLMFLGVPDREDVWVIRVSVRDVILIETAAGPIDRVIDEATKKLHALSQRIVAAATQNSDQEHPPDSEPPPTPKVGS